MQGIRIEAIAVVDAITIKPERSVLEKLVPHSQVYAFVFP